MRVECAVIPTKGPTVIAPSIAIEEVIVVNERQNTSLTTRSKDQIEWHGKRITIFSLENADAVGQIKGKKQIIVVLRQASNDGFVHIGLIAVQIPQMIQVHSHNLSEDVKPPALFPYALSYARLDGAPVVILDVGYLARLRPN